MHKGSAATRAGGGRAAGFTLIELLAVIAILAILMVILVTQLGGSEKAVRARS